MSVDGKALKAIFMEALDKHSPGARSAYLDEACRGDIDLRARIDALLVAHERPDALLDKPATDHVGASQTARPLDFLEPSTRPGSLGRLGHYEVLEMVGQGGMGSVLRAFDEKLHRIVAVKVLVPELAGNASARQRFVREARAAAAVTHENVIAIHAVEDDGKIPYLIMQFVEGCTLQEKLDRTGPLPIKEILRLGVQIADGLAAAHRQGLVHRDVKPANILLENGIERVKITDFGLARAVGDASLTRSGWIAGTPAFMSPEQANGERVDHRSDLFSLGSVLYAIGAGHPPFRAESAIAVLKRVCEETPRPLREVNPEVPEWLSEIVAKLQEKVPKERFASAAEVAAVLSRHLAQLQSSTDSGFSENARTNSGRTEKRAMNRRRPVVILGGLLVLIGLGTASWFGYQAWSASRQDTRTSSAPPTSGSTSNEKLASSTAPPTPVPSPSKIPPERLVLEPSKKLPGHRHWVTALAFSLDGKVLASGSLDYSIILWNTSDWTPRGRLTGHVGEVTGLAFSPDSSKLASTCLAKDECAIRLWDVATATRAGTVGETRDGLFAVAWLPGGKSLVTAGRDNQLTFWDLATGEHESIDKVCSEHVRGVSISPDGQVIATGGTGPTRLWDRSTQKEIPSQLPPDLCPTFVPPAGTHLAGLDHLKGSVSICDLKSGKVRTWRAHPGKIEGLAVSADGRYVATVGTEGMGFVWSIADGKLVAELRGHLGGARDVAFTPDGTKLATSGLNDHSVLIWDLQAAGLVRKE